MFLWQFSLWLYNQHFFLLQMVIKSTLWNACLVRKCDVLERNRLYFVISSSKWVGNKYWISFSGVIELRLQIYKNSTFSVFYTGCVFNMLFIGEPGVLWERPCKGKCNSFSVVSESTACKAETTQDWVFLCSSGTPRCDTTAPTHPSSWWAPNWTCGTIRTP